VTTAQGYGGIPSAWAGRHDPPGSLPDLIHRKLKRDLLAWARILPKHARVLDLGCGRGEMLLELAKARPDLRLTGLDLSKEMLAEAARLLGGRVPLSRGDALRLPFADGVFDAVLALDLMQNFDEERALGAFIPEAFRVSAGWLLLEIKNPGSLWLIRALRRLAGSWSNAGPLRRALGWDVEPAGLKIHVHRPARILRGLDVTKVFRPWPVLPSPVTIRLLRKAA